MVLITMNLSIAIVSWNTRDILDQCLTSIYETSVGIDLEVIVVDNASADGSSSLVFGKYPQTRLIENTDNVGFARANNQAYALSTGKYFLLLNPDTVCLPNALLRLVTFMEEHPDAGAVGPLVLNPDMTLQYSWARFPTLMSESLGRLDRRVRGRAISPSTADEVRAIAPFMVDWVGGCCLLIRRDAVEQIGLMDESLFMYSEETDWCLRLYRAGWTTWVQPASEVIHLGGQSSSQVPAESAIHLRRSKMAYFRKHYGCGPGVIVSCMLALRAQAKRILRKER
jgi:GT2 family glycosyltransferase